MIIIIPLDINPFDKGFFEHLDLTFKERTELFERAIKKTSEDLQKKFPDALLIFPWREYGISGPYYPMTPDDEEYFDSRMLKLTNKNVAIISGAAAVDEPFDTIVSKLTASDQTENKSKNDPKFAAKKFAELKSHFDSLPHIAQKEKELHSSDTEWTFSKEREKHDALEKLYMAATEKKPEIKVRTNTCRIYYTDKEGSPQIFKHGKSAPYHDTKDNPLVLFQPATPRKRNPHFSLFSPDAKEEFKCKVHICRDTLFLDPADDKPTLLQFIISSSSYIFNANLRTSGDYIIHLDSNFRPRLITKNKDLAKSSSVQMFRVNLLDQELKLEGPLKPYVPLEMTIQEKLTAAINNYQSLLKTLEKIYKKFNAIKKSKKIYPDEALNAGKFHLEKSLAELKTENPLYSYLQADLKLENDIFSNYYVAFIETWQKVLSSELAELTELQKKFYAFDNASQATIHLNFALLEIQERDIYHGKQNYLEAVASDILKSIGDHVASDEYIQDINTRRHAPVAETVSGEHKALPGVEVKKTGTR